MTHLRKHEATKRRGKQAVVGKRGMCGPGRGRAMMRSGSRGSGPGLLSGGWLGLNLVGVGCHLESEVDDAGDGARDRSTP